MRDVIEERIVTRDEFRGAIGKLMTTELAEDDVIVMQSPSFGTQYVAKKGGKVKLKVLRPGVVADGGGNDE